jgi:uncharacterized membrane protein YfcA
MLALALMLATDAVNRQVLELVIMALPALGVGIALGLLLFGRVPDAGFRRAVLVLLLATSAGLVAKPTPARNSASQNAEPLRTTVPSASASSGEEPFTCFSGSRC